MLFSGLGGVFTAAFSDAMKRRCASSSVKRSFGFAMPNPQMPDATQINVRQESILRRIGTVVTHWSFFEAVIEDMIAGFLGSEIHWVYTLTSEQSISARIESIRALARLRLTEGDFSDFEARLNKFKEFVPLRNKVVHGLWAETPDPEICQVSSVRGRGRLKFQTEYMNADYLEWLDAEIYRAGMGLFQFGQDFGVINRPDDVA